MSDAETSALIRAPVRRREGCRHRRSCLLKQAEARRAPDRRQPV